MNQLPDTALIVVATLVGFVTGVILLGCILVIWNHCVRGRRKSVKKHQPKERYVPLDPHPSFDFVRVEDHSLPQAEEPSKPFHFESRSPSPQPGTPAEVLEKRQELYRCIQDFEPRKIDDVKLEIGDQVNIYMTFTDGWCHGFNITKNTKGIFPIQCIRMETFDQDSIYSSDSEAYELPPKAPEGSGKLLFSMIPAEEALEIVNSMEPETRNQYFENSLPNGSNLSLNKKSSKESLNGRDRADFHWSMLRTGWRDAVKADLQTSFDAWAAKRNHNAFWRLMIDNYRLDG